jgi:beta-1,4-mannosyl-glycoprotein beta-1,4-N-acetylglucosaminyltransferase
MKVYDCFPFFNELDLLEIRLEELYDVVDHFVVVESKKTFQKVAKPLYFADNAKRFARYSNKIIHVVVDRFPGFFSRFRVPRAWDYENHQREQILVGLKNAKPEDRVLISDVDEIPLREKFLEAARDRASVYVFEQNLCFFYLNNLCTHTEEGASTVNKDGQGFWRGPVMLNMGDLGSVNAARRLRDARPPDVKILSHSGWHFSYLGGTDQIIKKLEAYSHKEFNTPKYKNRQFIEVRVRQGQSLFDEVTKFRLLDIKDPRFKFPTAVTNNPEKYKNLILNP